jgi:hypothetical protein
MMFVERNRIRYAWTDDGRELRLCGPIPPVPPDDDLPAPCAACQVAFQPGDYCTFIVLGPGAHEEERRRCREGQMYNQVTLRVHWACATGETAPPRAAARQPGGGR